MDPALEALQARIRAAAQTGSTLRIRGGGTKDFYGGGLAGDVIDTRVYAGIIDYEPTELVISARAGTSLAAVESAMRARGQMLAFEPPRFAEGGTLGGVIASGLSGPRRPYAGAVRDHVHAFTDHRELEIMVRAGLTPMEAIAAATSGSAELAGLTDLGALTPGKSADFIVLDANPLDDIRNTRRISRVYLRGREVDRGAITSRTQR